TIVCQRMGQPRCSLVLKNQRTTGSQYSFCSRQEDRRFHTRCRSASGRISGVAGRPTTINHCITAMTRAKQPLISREQLNGYLDDALSDAETARVEDALRHSEPLRKQLRALMQERDRGEHSVGAVWRRHRLSCPNREHLGGYLMGILDSEFHDYV